MVTNIRFLLIIVMSLFYGYMIGQDEVEYESSLTFFVDFQLNYADYDGNFDKNLKDVNNIGFGISGLVQSSIESPWFYGLEINYLHLYSLNTNFDEFIDGTFINVNSTSTTSLFNFSPKFRYFLPINYINLYSFF